MVNSLHDTFIRFYGCAEWSRESGSKWHPRFAIDPFSDIELAALPAKPENKSQANLNDFMFNNTEEMRRLYDQMKKSSTKKFQSDCEEYGGQLDSKLMKYVDLEVNHPDPRKGTHQQHCEDLAGFKPLLQQVKRVRSFGQVHTDSVHIDSDYDDTLQTCCFEGFPLHQGPHIVDW